MTEAKSDRPRPRPLAVTISVTDSEREELRTLAKAADLDVSKLVRKWLRAAWRIHERANARVLSPAEVESYVQRRELGFVASAREIADSHEALRDELSAVDERTKPST